EQLVMNLKLEMYSIESFIKTVLMKLSIEYISNFRFITSCSYRFKLGYCIFRNQSLFFHNSSNSTSRDSPAKLFKFYFNFSLTIDVTTFFKNIYDNYC